MILLSMKLFLNIEIEYGKLKFAEIRAQFLLQTFYVNLYDEYLSSKFFIA